MTIEQALFFAQICRCFYCGNEFAGPRTKRNNRKCWTRDHLHPACKGNGRTKNMVLACGDCNAKKGNTPPTTEDIERAENIHQDALRILQLFNGSVPPEWHGTREPTPTRRATEIASRAEP